MSSLLNRIEYRFPGECIFLPSWTGEEVNEFLCQTATTVATKCCLFSQNSLVHLDLWCDLFDDSKTQDFEVDNADTLVWYSSARQGLVFCVVSLSKLSKVLLFRKRNHFFTDYFRDKFRVGPCSYTIWWRLNGKNIAGKSQQRREHTHFRWIFCGKCVSLSLLLFSQLCLWILEKRCGGGAVIDIRTAALRSSALVNGHRRRRSRFLLLHVVYWIFLFYVC